MSKQVETMEARTNRLLVMAAGHSKITAGILNRMPTDEVIDLFGLLRGEAKALETAVENVKDELLNRKKDGDIGEEPEDREGMLYKFSASWVEGRTYLNLEKVKKWFLKLGAQENQINRIVYWCSTKGAGYWRVSPQVLSPTRRVRHEKEAA